MAKKRKVKNPMSWEPPHILAARLRRIADDLEKPGPHRYWHRFKLEITNELESDIRDTLTVMHGAEEANQFITAMNCATLEEESNEQDEAFESALAETTERHGEALKKLADTPSWLTETAHITCMVCRTKHHPKLMCPKCYATDK